MNAQNGNHGTHDGTEATPGPQRRRVLLVEDSRNLQSALTELMESIGGFEVVGRALGESQATQWIQEHPRGWDIAIVDLVLEDGSGFNLFQRLLREHPDGHVIVFSEFASPVLKQKCLSLGAHAVFRKTELPEFMRYLEAARGG